MGQGVNSPWYRVNPGVADRVVPPSGGQNLWCAMQGPLVRLQGYLFYRDTRYGQLALNKKIRRGHSGQPDFCPLSDVQALYGPIALFDKRVLLASS